MLIRVTRTLAVFPELSLGDKARVLQPIARVSATVQDQIVTIDVQPPMVMSAAKFNRHCTAGDFVLVGQERRTRPRGR